MDQNGILDVFERNRRNGSEAHYLALTRAIVYALMNANPDINAHERINVKEVRKHIQLRIIIHLKSLLSENNIIKEL